MKPVQFIFTTCNIGSELALKKEISMQHPDLRPAFSRPGLVTFKNAGKSEYKPDFKLGSVFARTYGLTLGKTGEKEFSKFFDMNAVLHLYSRMSDNDFKELYLKLNKHFSTMPYDQIRNGTRVVHLIHIDGGEFLAGIHLHHEEHDRYPAGLPPIVVSEAIPSRAYLKLLQALEFFKLQPKAGETALEFGSSPGGACLALCELGVTTIGVDMAEMSSVLSSKYTQQFTHLKKNATQVQFSELPEKIDWILSDMNIPPAEVITMIKRFIIKYKGTLKGLILTAKMRDILDLELLHQSKADLKKLGFKSVRIKQLPANGSEVCIVAS